MPKITQAQIEEIVEFVKLCDKLGIENKDGRAELASIIADLASSAGDDANVKPHWIVDVPTFSE